MKITKIVALLLTFLMSFSSLQVTALTVFAADSSTTVKKVEHSAEDDRVLGTRLEVEMMKRDPITKNRSEIKPESEVAVYKNGQIVWEGKFRDGWKKATDLAPTTVNAKGKRLSDKQIAELDEVEFVLNKDISFGKKIGFGYYYGSLYITQSKLTIDLNGHILARSDFDSAANSGSVISVNESEVTIMDSNTKKVHLGDIKNHLWKSNPKDGRIALYGGVITGGHWRLAEGGAIYVFGSSNVTITGGNIAGNKATNGSGILVTDGSTVDMRKGTSQICYNDCRGKIQDGGAVCIDGNGTVKGGYVHHNYSEDYGAGVFFFPMNGHSKGTVSDMVIYANEAEEEGGGVYVHTKYYGATIKNCRIVKNYSGERGGGAYNTERALFQDCLISKNASKEHGGGICAPGKVIISGETIIRNNYKSSKKGMMDATDNSNLYIQSDHGLIANSIDEGSEIWVRTGTKAEKYNGISKKITSEKCNVVDLYFYSDNSDFHVKYQYDPAKKNFGHLYLEKGPYPHSPVRELTEYGSKKHGDYVVETGENSGQKFDLYKGVFEYNLMSTSKFSSASPFYYSDGYFFEDPDHYNRHLATMSINMAVAAFGRTTNAVGGNKYANHFANVKQLMSDIGCDDEDFFANQSYQMKPHYYGTDDQLSTIGVAISNKQVEHNGETYTIVPIAIRGGGYEVEWASNVTLGGEGEADGFSDAANQAFRHVQEYITNYKLSKAIGDGKVKFWVVGYSRAGATANLTSKRLVDYYGIDGNDVFGYTFEAPMGGREDAKIKNAPHTDFGEYKTIHNTVNELDFVTLVAPKEMGFIRYGVDHLVGTDYTGSQTADGSKIKLSYKTDSAYYKQRMKMVTQLRAINPYFNFYDDWDYADVYLFSSFIFGVDIISPGGNAISTFPNKECKNPYDFLRWFFARVQADGLKLTDLNANHYDKNNSYYNPDFTHSREYYATAQLLMPDGKNPNAGLKYSDKKYNFGYSTMSVEEAVCGFMVLMNTLPDSKIDEIMEVVQPGIDRFMDGIILKAIGLYNNYLNHWYKHSLSKKQSLINDLLHDILDPVGKKPTIWSILEPDQQKIIAEGLPVLMMFLLNYISVDYSGNVVYISDKLLYETDDGMWGLGTFLYNMDSLVSNHYQEVSVAWVRSYDSYYDNDTQAYKIKKDKTEKPVGSYDPDTNILTVEAESGSSIFYSLDKGTTWTLYTKPVEVETKEKDIPVYAISHGVESEINYVSANPWTGSMLGDGRVWFLIAGSAILIAGAVVVIERKRKIKI